MLYLLIALQLIDAVLTAKIIANGGRELNPLIAKLMGRIGVVPGLVLGGARAIIFKGAYLCLT